MTLRFDVGSQQLPDHQIAFQEQDSFSRILFPLEESTQQKPDDFSQILDKLCSTPPTANFAQQIEDMNPKRPKNSSWLIRPAFRSCTRKCRGGFGAKGCFIGTCIIEVALFLLIVVLLSQEVVQVRYLPFS